MSFTAGQISSAFLWSLSQKFVTKLINLAAYVILARMLLPEDFGVAGLALTFIMLMQIFIDQGFNEAIIQSDKLEEKDIHTAFWFNLLIGLVVMLVVMISAPLFANLMDDERVTPVLRTLALLLPLASLCIVPSALMRKELSFKGLTISNGIAMVIGSLAAIVAAFSGLGVWSLVVQQLATYISKTVFLYFITPVFPKLIISRSSSIKLWRFGKNMLGMNLVFIGYRFTERALIGSLFGAQLLGYYVFAFQLLSNIMDLVQGSLRMLILPVISKIQTDTARVISYYSKILRTAYAVSTPVLIGIFIVAPEMVQTVFGAQWQGSVEFIRIITVIIWLRIPAYFSDTVNIALGKPETSLLLASTDALIKALLIIIFASSSVFNILISHTIFSAVFTIASLYMYHRNIPVDLKFIGKSAIPSLVSAVPMALTTLTLLSLLSNIDIIVSLSFTVLLSAGIYLFILLSIDKTILSTAKTLQQTAFQR